MTVHDLVQSALASISRTRGRSILTMLGIVIGIMSVILMLSIGEAAQRYILDQISSFGSDILFVMNGPSVDQGTPSLFIKQSLVPKDVQRLQLLPWITTIAGKTMQSNQLTANGLDTKIQLVGTMPDELRFADIKVEQGIFFSQTDVDSRNRVAVLGADIAEKAFGAEDPLGKTVKISKIGFRVIGVMERVGTKGTQNIDKQVYIPVTAGLDLSSQKYLTYITLKTNVNLNDAKDRITSLIRDYHNIDNPTGDPVKDDFHIQTQEDLVRSASQITSILQILLISIAAISLLVGGIGIMNIMYVSVTERIREIGLRKSLGATRRDILGQFLVEAVIQTVIGGMIGITLGVSLSWAAVQAINTVQSGWTFAISTNGIILGLTVSTAIGVIFGYFPARRAARLNPIEALRFE